MNSLGNLRKLVRRCVKLLFFPFMANYYRRKYLHRKVLSSTATSQFLVGESANEKIRTLVEGNNSFMVARFGSGELLATIEIQRRLSLSKIELFYEDFALRDSPWDSEANFAGLRNNAGFFPINFDMLLRFCSLMLKSMPEVDLLGSWLEGESIFERELRNALICDLWALEPYYHKNPWSAGLKGKKVLAIHPFAKSIAQQYYEKREKLFDNPNVLPEFNLSTMKSVQSIAGNETGFVSWFEALDFMITEIKSRDFDVAIIGCGAYGFPIAAEVKRLGKKAIHLGGATQILFGIKGTRWDSHPIISKLYNEFWVRPSEEETPKNSKTVEGGCYW